MITWLYASLFSAPGRERAGAKPCSVCLWQQTVRIIDGCWESGPSWSRYGRHGRKPRTRRCPWTRQSGSSVRPHLDPLQLGGPGPGQPQVQHPVADPRLDARRVDRLGQRERALVVAGLVLEIE